MSSIGKFWAGNVFGTNTGKLFIEFENTGPNVTGVLRFMDGNFGLFVYEVSGVFEDKLKLEGEIQQMPDGMEAGVLTIEATLTSEGNLTGIWKSTLGTGGTFQAFPHDTASSQLAEEEATSLPEQLHIKRIELGSMRLGFDDVKKLFSQIKENFKSDKLIVTYNGPNNEESVYEKDFLKNKDNLKDIDYLKITIQELEAYGINRAVEVELRASGSNELRVSGVDNLCVIGTTEKLAKFLKGYQSFFITAYKKFGLSFNQVIFFVMIAIMPSIDLWQERIVFASAILVLLSILFWANTRYVSNTIINMTEKKPNFIIRHFFPSMFSLVMNILAAVIAGLILYWLLK